MNKKEFEFILEQGEGLKIEFKESFDKSIAKEIVAFANSNGGRIFLGVTDSGDSKGIHITNRLKSQVQDLARNCDPSITVKLEKFEDILIVHVDEGENKPYKCSLGFFMRIGANSQKMSRDEIIDFINEEGKLKFDEVINKEFNYPKDFNKKKLEEYLSQAKISKIISQNKLLEELGVLKNSKFTNAGVLFFAKSPQKFISHSVFTCVLFRDKEGSDIIDRQEIEGSLIQIVEGAIKFVEKNTRVAYRFTGKPKREDVYEYSLEAIREAVINSVMHRDYLESGHNNILRIFPDKLTITNVWLKPSWFKVGRDTFRRNKVIADLFARIRWIEKVGSGFARMRNYCREVRAPIFKLDIDKKYFRIIFFKSRDYLELAGKKIERAGESKVDEWLTQVNTRLTQELSDREKEILNFIFKNSKITSSECQELLKISRVMVNRYFNRLIKRKLIERKGAGKHIYYVLFRQKMSRGVEKGENK